MINWPEDNASVETGPEATDAGDVESALRRLVTTTLLKRAEALAFAAAAREQQAAVLAEIADELRNLCARTEAPRGRRSA